MRFIDVVIRRGKRKSVKVANERGFEPGLKVDFLRANRFPDMGFTLIGKATVERVRKMYGVVEFDALPDTLKIGDIIHTGSEPEPICGGIIGGTSDLEPGVGTTQFLDWSV